MIHRYRMPSLAAAIIVFLAASASAQEERLTLEWIFSEEGRNSMSLPDHAWLDDGTLMIYDERAPKADRTIESFDPRNGRRGEVVDAAEARAALEAHFEPDEPYEELGWPDAFDPAGRYALYEKSGDIVLLDLTSTELIPVAVTDDEEKSARFSPDGQKVAFVRDNDLYVWDLAERDTTRLTSDGSDTLLNGTVSWGLLGGITRACRPRLPLVARFSVDRLFADGRIRCRPDALRRLRTESA